ncbi:MAG: BTAD domain-containing putative transcriptional regulator [Stackebrandtia sp.]
MLGPLEVETDAGPVQLAAPKQRLLLAVLLSRAPRAVSVDQLIDVLWESEPPASARNSLADHVRRLRKALGDKDRIAWESEGYLLRIAEDEGDASRFEKLYRRGMSAEADPQQCSRVLSEAEVLWRGPAYGELAGHMALTGESVRLDGLRLSALEKRCGADLALGRHAALVDELSPLVAANPLREKFRAQLMVALYRGGRQAEALEVYRDGKQCSIAELGLDPGPELRELERAILAGDASISAPAVNTAATAHLTPAELPAGPASFTGRRAEADRLCEALRPSADNPIWTISGPGGVGKSALALHAAHRVAEHFPDGQLYVNLNGAAAEVKPLEPGEVLTRMLRSLGHTESASFSHLDEAAARFRSATAGKRLLIVLDNAGDAGQVRPLLPGGSGCAVVVTSRRSLSSLDGAAQLALDVLAEPSAIDLLSRLIGNRRAMAEPGPITEVASLCGYLPLALCISASRLQARPNWSVAALAERLRAEDNRLSELEADDRAVRASFAVSYRDLAGETHGDAVTRMFRLLGLHDGPDIGLGIAASLAECGERDAEDRLEALVAAQLVESHRIGRYHIHELLRLYARTRAIREDSPTDRHAAIRRMLHRYLSTSVAAAKILNSYVEPDGLRLSERTADALPLREPAEAATWLLTEFDNMTRVLSASGPIVLDGPAIAVGLASALTPLRGVLGRHAELLELCETAARLTERTSQPRLRAASLALLGHMQQVLGQSAPARRSLEQALESCRGAGDTVREAVVLARLGEAHRREGDVETALDYARQAAELNRLAGTGNRGEGEATLRGFLYRDLHEYTRSVNAFKEAAQVAGDAGEFVRQAALLHHLGNSYAAKHNWHEAKPCFERAIATMDSHGQGHTYLRASVSWDLGEALYRLGNEPRAAEYFSAAADIALAIGLISEEERQAVGTDPHPSKPDALRLG